jgi:hypothetical protein
MVRMSESGRARELCRAAFAGLSAFCRVDRELSAQFERAQRDFGGDSGLRIAGQRALRYFEWFGLERAMDGHSAPPIAAFVALGCPGIAEELRPWCEALADLRCEVGIVLASDPEGLDLRVASDETQLRVLWPTDPMRPGDGDSVLGAFVPVHARESFVATDGVAIQSGSSVYELFAGEATEQRLAGRMEEELRPTLLEIDRFLALRSEQEPRSRRVLERELGPLLDAGYPELSVADLAATLRETQEPGTVFGPILERCAFDSDVDLELLRRLLLEFWTRMQLEDDDQAAQVSLAPRAADGAEILARIEAAESRGERLLDVLDEIEEELGVPASERGEEDELIPERMDWATDELSSLSALVREFAWERQQATEPGSRLVGGSEDQATEQVLESFVQTLEGQGLREPESVGATQLAGWLVSCWQQSGIEACLAQLAELGRFESWLEDVHELRFSREAGELRVELSESRSRVLELEARLKSDAAPQGVPLGWHVVEGDASSGWRLEHEREHVDMPGDWPFAVGDLVLGAVAADGASFAGNARILPVALARHLQPSEDDDD